MKQLILISIYCENLRKLTQSISSKILCDFKVTNDPPSLDSGTLFNNYFINARIF